MRRVHSTTSFSIPFLLPSKYTIGIVNELLSVCITTSTIDVYSTYELVTGSITS